MQTNYDKIADNYSQHWEQKVTENLWYDELTENLIKNPKWKNILDYGCWSGDIMKILTEKGANVMWVDISEEMVKLAQKKAPHAKIELINQHKPFANIQKEIFDIISMNYVLCVLSDPLQIQNIIRWAYESLKPWGTLFIQNANWDRANWVEFASYKLHLKDNLKEGDKIFVTLKLDTPLEIEDYFFSQETYKKRLSDIGFRHIKIHELIWSKEEWRTWKESEISPCYIIEAVK